MAPKKDKGKAEEAPKSGFTEVERTFLELQVTECNRKIARLRAAVEEYETRNEDLQRAYDKLDEDRADIISFLKKSLNAKNEENVELKEKVKGLEETRDIETKEFKQTVAELERNFTVMKDQLSSENKLLASKLNTLEEFRAIRDDLMRKFEKQEQDFQDQEMKYKRIIYDAEKKYVISKDKLKKEMEARLLQLAQDFQDATELRIAASTQRVIRENIAINNELDNMLSTQAKLAEQNEKFKEREKAARIAKELAEEERDKAINKNVIQLKVIEQLTTAFHDMKNNKSLQEKKILDFEAQEAKIQKLTKENEKLSLQVRILEQNLHNVMSIQNKEKMEASQVFTQSERLKSILSDAAVVLRAALKLDQWAITDPSKEIMDRQNLLSRLLEIVSQYRDIQAAESIETLASMGQVYKEGDLGFIPKATSKKSLHSAELSSFISKEVSRKGEHSQTSLSVTSSVGSLKTLPSIKLMPIGEQESSAGTVSAISFVTSSQSEVISEESKVEETAKSKINELLEKSKLMVQKSIMKDFVEVKKSLATLGQEDLSDEDIVHDKKSKVAFEDVTEIEVGEEHVEGPEEEVEIRFDDLVKEEDSKEAQKTDEPEEKAVEPDESDGTKEEQQKDKTEGKTEE